jgi:hypothetical protein
MPRVQPILPSVEVLHQVDEFFMNKGPVHQTLHNIAHRLSEAKIDYAVIGGMALALHGFVRPTQDVDLLLSPGGLRRFHQELVGLGYLPKFQGARKHFRDTDTGVDVEVITSGEYPDDGKSKRIVFPDPADVAISADGYKVVDLKTLIELKLASGLSAEHRRLRDLADVQQLIETLNLPESLSNDIDISLQDEYQRLWYLAQQSRSEVLETND